MKTFAPPVLRISVEQHRRILAHCYFGLPDEACGLLAGPVVGGEATGFVSEVYPAVNADASSRTYTVDGRDYLRASRDAESRGHEIVGVWHSHTHTDPYPSPTDVRQAVDPMWVYVIVSLRDEAPMLRAYRIRDGEIAECQVVVIDRPPSL
ncbi:MAG: Mov34/MPN/PAD-1 family protein [Acidimicrobiia bacterium]